MTNRPIRLSVVLVLLGCLGCTGGKGCAEGRREVLTAVDDEYDSCSDFASFACGTNGQRPGRLQESVANAWSDAAAPAVFMGLLASGAYQDGRPATAVLREVYVRCTDANARDLGLRELRAQLDEISRIRTQPELARTLGVLRRGGIVREQISLERFLEGAAANERYVARVALGDPALPAKAYADKGHVLADLRRHWQALATLVGGIAPSEVEGALRVDRWLAAAMRPDLSDPTSALQPLASRAALEKARFPWPDYLNGLGLSLETPIRPAAADSLAAIDALARLPFADLRSHLKMLLVESSAEYVALPALEEEVRFHHEVVEGRPHAPYDLPYACQYMVARDFRPWLGEAFAASLPTSSAEGPTRELFNLLRDRFARTVAGATWLDDSTRRTAAGKVSRIALRFAADPNPGLDGIVLQPGSLLDAVQRSVAHISERPLAQIGTVGERRMRPQYDSFAAYFPFVNSVWLATQYRRDPWIQQRPFNAINFGSMGVVMGHEMAHSLALKGRRFDEAGIKHETWSKEAVAAFESRTACLEARLATFDAGAKWKVDGHRTLDEDLAELVGIQIALAALDAEAGSDIRTRDSRRREFFLAYAQQLCGGNSGYPFHHTSDESHSPVGRILSGILANVPEFADTFHCSAGTRMAPRDRCAIWQ